MFVDFSKLTWEEFVELTKRNENMNTVAKELCDHFFKEMTPRISIAIALKSLGDPHFALGMHFAFIMCELLSQKEIDTQVENTLKS